MYKLLLLLSMSMCLTSSDVPHDEHKRMRMLDSQFHMDRNNRDCNRSHTSEHHDTIPKLKRVRSFSECDWQDYKQNQEESVDKKD